MPISPCPSDMRWVNPYLTVRDVDWAKAFYMKAFGFREKFTFKDKDGKSSHAELTYHDCTVMIGAEIPMHRSFSPKGIGGTPVTIYVYTPDVDKIAQRAEDAGGRILQPPEDKIWGDRTCIIEDPEGHRWCFATHIKDVSPDEMKP